MIKRLAALLLLGLLATAVRADRLVLLDGRSFTGTVTIERDTVLIEMGYGTLEFSRDQVAHIDFADTPEVKLAARLAGIDRDDPGELYQVALWAKQNDLPRQAEDLYQQVLQLDTDHAGARRALGFVHADGRWRTFEKALELTRGKLEAGHTAALLTDLLPKLSAAASTPEQQHEADRLAAHARLRDGRFSAAAASFRTLSENSEAPRSARYEAIADVLDDNPDGMYMLTESYPPQAGLLGDPGGVLTPGPASLADPLVLQAALRDQAVVEIGRGRELMAEAQKLSASDAEAARARWFRASRAFDRADAMVEDIARSYRVELARQRIAQLRHSIEDDARQFDQTLNTLGRQDLSPQQYHALVRRMIRRLDTVRGDLRTILDLTEPYPRELILEAQWAQADLEKIESMRQTLADELHGEN
jgi:hypothetical protein